MKAKKPSPRPTGTEAPSKKALTAELRDEATEALLEIGRRLERLDSAADAFGRKLGQEIARGTPAASSAPSADNTDALTTPPATVLAREYCELRTGAEAWMKAATASRKQVDVRRIVPTRLLLVQTRVLLERIEPSVQACACELHKTPRVAVEGPFMQCLSPDLLGTLVVERIRDTLVELAKQGGIRDVPASSRDDEPVAALEHAFCAALRSAPAQQARLGQRADEATKEKAAKQDTYARRSAARRGSIDEAAAAVVRAITNPDTVDQSAFAERIREDRAALEAATVRFRSRIQNGMARR